MCSFSSTQCLLLSVFVGTVILFVSTCFVSLFPSGWVCLFWVYVLWVPCWFYIFQEIFFVVWLSLDFCVASTVSCVDAALMEDISADCWWVYGIAFHVMEVSICKINEDFSKEYIKKFYHKNITNRTRSLNSSLFR